MPEQSGREVLADNILSRALLESQVRNIRLRGIEARLEDEIEELGASWLTPMSAHKAASLSVAKEMVTKVMHAGEKEQERFEKEIKGEGR